MSNRGTQRRVAALLTADRRVWTSRVTSFKNSPEACHHGQVAAWSKVETLAMPCEVVCCLGVRSIPLAFFAACLSLIAFLSSKLRWHSSNPDSTTKSRPDKIIAAASRGHQTLDFNPLVPLKGLELMAPQRLRTLQRHQSLYDGFCHQKSLWSFTISSSSSGNGPRIATWRRPAANTW